MNCPTLLVGMQASKTILEKIWRHLKNVNIALPYDPVIPFMRIYPKECNTCYSGGPAHPCLCSADHNSQVMETIKMIHYW
jgi:hypothetical protein